MANVTGGGGLDMVTRLANRSTAIMTSGTGRGDASMIEFCAYECSGAMTDITRGVSRYVVARFCWRHNTSTLSMTAGTLFGRSLEYA